MGEPQTQRPLRRLLRRLLLWSLVLGALFASALVFAHTRMAREYAGREVANVLRSELGLIARIDDVHLNARNLEWVARGIRLDHPTHGRFARAAELRIRPSWRALILGRIDLSTIRLERPDITLLVRDNKVINGPEIASSAGGGEPPTIDDLPFNWVHIEQGRVRVDADPRSAELRRIELHVQKQPGGVLRVELEVGSGFVTHEGGQDRLLSLQVAASISDKSVGVETVRVETPELRVAARGVNVAFPLGSKYSGDLLVDVSLPHLLTWPLGVELPEIAGDVSLRGHIEGDARGPSGSLDLVLRRVGIEGFGFGERVAFAVALSPEKVGFEGRAEAIREGGYLDLKGELGLGEGLPLKVYGDAHEVSFAKLMEQLGVSENAIVDWNINGQFTLEGPCNPLRLQGPMRMPTRDFKVLRHAWHSPPPGGERRIMGVERALLDGTVAVTPAGIFFQDVAIALPTSRLHADVLLGFDNRLRVDAQSTDWGLADAAPLIDLALDGRGSFELEVGGTFNDPTLHGHVIARDFSLHNFRFGDIETDFALDDDLMGVHFPHITAVKRASKYEIDNAFLDFREDAFRAGGKLLAERMEAADFYHMFRYDEDERYTPYQGVVTGTVALDYSLGRPEDSTMGTLAAVMALEVPSATLDGYTVSDGHFEGRFDWLDPDQGYEGAKLTVERLALRKGEGTVSVSGRMGLGGALDLVALGDRIALRDVEGIGDRTADVAGTVGFNASIKGTPPKPRVDFDVAMTALSLRGESLGDGRAYVRLTDRSDPWIEQALQWPVGAPPPDAQCGHGREGLARGRWPEDPPQRTSEGPRPALEQPMAFVICGDAMAGQVVADLAIGRTRVSPLRGRVTLASLDFGRLLPRVRGRPPLQGTLSADLMLTDGALKEPETLGGRVLLSDVRVGQEGVELRSDGAIDARFSRGRLEIGSAKLIGPASELALTGGASLAGGLELRVDGRVGLGLLTTVSQTITQAQGEVQVGFNVSGTLAEPAVFGRATVRDAGLKIASFPEAVRNVYGTVSFSERRIVVDEFRSEVASGTVRLRGDATLAGMGIGAYDLQIDASGLALKPRDGMSLKMGGRANLSWKKGDRIPLLAGTLRIDELIYTRAVKVDRTIGDLTASQRVEARGYDPDADLLALDLRLEHSRPLFIRNNVVDAELRLETDKLPFRLVGTDQRFGMLGHVTVRKGTLRFRDQAFDIRQGDLTFDDETKIDPSFDLRASTEVRRTTAQTMWRVQIHAYGKPDEFRFDLASDPYLSEDDIALLLTLGMTHSELAQLKTGDLTSTAALEALATVTGVEREMQRALPQIDDFHVASAYSEQSNRTEPQLFVGKRIARNVRLNASTGIAESRDFSTGMQVQLNDQTAVEAMYNNGNANTASQLGDVGVDLKWRLEFD